MKTLLLCVLLLGGCATIKGVEISDAEREACEAQGCTVWTPQELKSLGLLLFKRGYEAGFKSV